MCDITLLWGDGGGGGGGEYLSINMEIGDCKEVR